MNLSRKIYSQNIFSNKKYFIYYIKFYNLFSILENIDFKYFKYTDNILLNKYYVDYEMLDFILFYLYINKYYDIYKQILNKVKEKFKLKLIFDYIQYKMSIFLIYDDPFSHSKLLYFNNKTDILLNFIKNDNLWCLEYLYSFYNEDIYKSINNLSQNDAILINNLFSKFKKKKNILSIIHIK